MNSTLRILGARLAIGVLVGACVANAQTSIAAPASVKSGSGFDVTVSGPLEKGAIITIVKKNFPAGRRSANYAYFHKPPGARVLAFDEPGEYELRLYSAKGYKLLASRPISIESVPATLDAPASADAGAAIRVGWTGPGNKSDTIRLTEVGAPADSRLAYTFAAIKNPAPIAVPDKAGEYEIRYVTGQAKLILASRRIRVGGTAASVSAPAEARAGAKIEVAWKGPGNPADVINIVPVGATKRLAWGYPGHGNPVTIVAPLQTGEYEIRYQTGQSRAILARAPLRVTPAAEQPGKLAVVGPAKADLGGAAVEIILDASGSMLQRIGSARRIDIAKETLAELTSKAIPSGTPFALRVFGKEVNSCQTDLEIPAAPLEPGAVAAKISAIQAKNNAKTPIAASLSKVSADLRGVSGQLIVVLVTDGEETCGGDPAAAIKALRAAGVAVKVNIVGFAIGDDGLKEAFQDWADLGGGAYFDAADAAGLRKAFSGVLQPSFEVLNSAGEKVADGVAGGAAIAFPPGAYTVKTRLATLPVKVESAKTATVTLTSGTSR